MGTWTADTSVNLKGMQLVIYAVNPAINNPSYKNFTNFFTASAKKNGINVIQIGPSDVDNAPAILTALIKNKKPVGLLTPILDRFDNLNLGASSFTTDLVITTVGGTFGGPLVVYQVKSHGLVPIPSIEARRAEDLQKSIDILIDDYLTVNGN